MTYIRIHYMSFSTQGRLCIFRKSLQVGAKKYRTMADDLWVFGFDNQPQYLEFWNYVLAIREGDFGG